jgi:hypothetical protein
MYQCIYVQYMQRMYPIYMQFMQCMKCIYQCMYVQYMQCMHEDRTATRFACARLTSRKAVDTSAGGAANIAKRRRSKQEVEQLKCRCGKFYSQNSNAVCMSSSNFSGRSSMHVSAVYAACALHICSVCGV